jgi:hypothetical protein
MVKKNENVKRVKLTELEKCKREYIRKIDILNSKLIGTEWDGILDTDNTELIIASEHPIDGNIKIPYTRKLAGEEPQQLEAFLYHISCENKLMLFCVDEADTEEIVLECPSIKRKIEKYCIGKMLKEYFKDGDEESIKLI